VFRIQGNEEEPGEKIEKKSPVCYMENHKGMLSWERVCFMEKG
jgi:hypothetical protein